MANLTPEQFRQYQIRMGQITVPKPGTGQGCSQEVQELHAPIMKWLRDHRVPFKHENPGVVSTSEPGSPDFIFPWHGRWFAIECKTKNGKLSIDQLAWKMGCEVQGCAYHVIRSMDEFYALVL